MKVRFWGIGFILWIISDYFVTRLIVPSFVIAEDKQLWLQVFFLALQWMPLYTIGTVIVSFAQIFIFGYVLSWIWDKIGEEITNILRRPASKQDLW